MSICFVFTRLVPDVDTVEQDEVEVVDSDEDVKLDEDDIRRDPAGESHDFSEDAQILRMVDITDKKIALGIDVGRRAMMAACQRSFVDNGERPDKDRIISLGNAEWQFVKGLSQARREKAKHQSKQTEAIRQAITTVPSFKTCDPSVLQSSIKTMFIPNITDEGPSTVQFDQITTYSQSKLFVNIVWNCTARVVTYGINTYYVSSNC